MSVKVGVLPVGTRNASPLMLRRITDSGLDHFVDGDHVSFFVGAGTDGLVSAANFLGAVPDLPVFLAVYLLVLRHPVLVARQLATLAELAPGKLTLGVGIGGEDPHELEICGVDPRTRGRRMDSHLTILRDLLEGKTVTAHDEFFDIDEALIVPPPVPAIPIVIGGRSDAALRRAARFGDGWIGIWNSAKRFRTAVDEIEQSAALLGRKDVAWRHAMQVWCGFGGDSASSRSPLAGAMERMYQIPFERFERYSPYGTPQTVAEFLLPYREAGCTTFNLIACGTDQESAIDGAAQVRRILNS